MRVSGPGQGLSTLCLHLTGPFSLALSGCRLACCRYTPVKYRLPGSAQTRTVIIPVDGRPGLGFRLYSAGFPVKGARTLDARIDLAARKDIIFNYPVVQRLP